MGALTTNRNKRYAESQFQSSSLLGYDHLHVAKKPKSEYGMIPTTSSVSRLNLYPKQVTPIPREIQAPILVVKGFTANPSKLDTSFSRNLNSRRFSGNSDSGGGDRMGNYLFSDYNRKKEAAIRSCQVFKREKDGEIVKDVDNLNSGRFSGNSDSGGDRMGNDLFSDYYRKKEAGVRSCQFFKMDKDGEIVKDVDNDNDGEGDSGVEEVEKEDFNKSVEIQTIRVKYKELDSKAEENLRLQASTSSDVVDGKALDSLSLNQVDVDDGVPLYRKLVNESARKHDERLRNLNFDIKQIASCEERGGCIG